MSEGTALGKLEGFNEGTKLGVLEGMSDGVEDGLLEGRKLGALEGSRDGEEHCKSPYIWMLAYLPKLHTSKSQESSARSSIFSTFDEMI